jgi:hypothetical protein
MEMITTNIKLHNLDVVHVLAIVAPSSGLTGRHHRADQTSERGLRRQLKQAQRKGNQGEKGGNDPRSRLGQWQSARNRRSKTRSRAHSLRPHAQHAGTSSLSLRESLRRGGSHTPM